MNIVRRFIENLQQYSIYNIKWMTYGGVCVFLAILEIINTYLHAWTFEDVVIDLAGGLLIAVIVIESSFWLILKKEKELSEQIDQLSDAYEYIGVINRKISTLLDIKHPMYGHQKLSNDTIKHDAEQLLKNLISLTEASSGYLSLEDNSVVQKVFSDADPELIIRKLFQKLDKIGFKTKLNSTIPGDRDIFIEHDISEELLAKYVIIVKPVYLAQRELGHVYLLYTSPKEVDEFDYKVLNLFSFYFSLLFFASSKP